MILDRMCTLLFVPGHQPARFDKALPTGADGIVLDLEDAVSIHDKDMARAHVFDWLRASGKTSGGAAAGALAPLRCVRLNAQQGPYFAADDTALCEALAAGHAPDVVVLPKVESAQDIRACRERWQRHTRVLPQLIVLIETAVGLQQVASIAQAPGVSGLGFGAADLSADLGCDMSWETLLYARGRIAHAAALGRVALLDVPHLELDDEAGLRAQTLRAKAMGFTGKFSIHPRQVGPIRECFLPTAQEVERAQALVQAADRAQGKVCVIDGRMVDEPVVRSARQVLARVAVSPPSKVTP